ncbi:MAG TPA: folylpolyglutamate synthase/dihydrofolate synthase family protein [Gemmatimonadales bacterium]|nr:folylpolyglutamate synthase/dihydrofolate synthase family protein [Gemmatimonadales bacterium]
MAGRGCRLTFEDACHFLFARQAGRIKWSLGPTEGLLDVLGHPERHYPTIHVGGTNGKGSTCAFVANELRAQGWRVGLYTSPHLVSPCERVTVDGVPISEDAFAEWTVQLKPHIERLDASFFEATTAIAFADLAARDVDIAVVEVGLGGRLDATNVLTPLVSAVTKIALEHVDYLGSDLKGIAREKAGIAKPKVPFVTGESDHDIRAEIVKEAKRRGAHPIIAVDTALRPRKDTVLGLRGRHQMANALVAHAVLNELPAPFGPVGKTLPASFATAYIPGRFDIRGKWIFDVAHNPDGMRVVAQALAEHGKSIRRPLHALVGIRNDKDWRAMLDSLRPLVDRLTLTVPPSIPLMQRWSVEDIGPDVSFEPDFERALHDIQEDAGTILVTGSFHTVGDAMARLPGFAPVG